MIKPKIKEIKGLTIDKYQKHPRILELRLIMLFKTIHQAYDYNSAFEFFQSLAKLFRCNWQLLSGVLNNVFKIRDLEKKDKNRFRQEVVFMGLLYNESRYAIVKNYLNLSLPSIYKKELQFENFITQRWLDDLDKNIVLCGIDGYKLEVLRFLEGLENFLEGLGRVSIPKT